MSKTVRTYGGRYEVSGQIGSGGMADVFLAKDNLLGRPVALKILHPEHARDRAFIERFRREAQSAARLNDPRVVSVFDWGSDDATYYIVMEYVEGQTLRDLIESEGRLTVRRAAEIAAEVCDALNLAHEQGIVHRDIKPGNILITSAGATKVTDFGIARAATATGQTVTQTGTVIGTAAYLSPEQAQGMPVDLRSDVYSAAVVLFEMLIGEVPFKGDSAVAIAFKHVKEDPPLPSSVNPDIPPEMDAVVMKGLAKNPDNRYQSAREMGSDLRRFLRAEPVIATPLLGEDDTVAGSRMDDLTAVVAGVDVEARTEAFPPPTSRQRRRLAYALTFLLLAGILIAGAALLFSLFSGGRTEVVPQLVGLSFEDAERLLQPRGLEGVHGGEEFSETYGAGIVVGQNPEDGVKVPPGSRVTLIVSKGPERVEVPDLVGKTQQEAEKLLQDANLQVGQVRNEFSDQVEQGRVISQDPAPRTEVQKGAPVNLVISGGRQPVLVPPVIGLTEADGRRLVIEAGLVPKVGYVCDVSRQDDRVLDQDPDPNTEVPEGSDVNLSVNDTATVPSVLGNTREVATQRLEAAGFKVKVQTQDLSPVKDRVVNQDPVAGTVACRGDTVTITVEE